MFAVVLAVALLLVCRLCLYCCFYVGDFVVAFCVCFWLFGDVASFCVVAFCCCLCVHFVVAFALAFIVASSLFLLLLSLLPFRRVFAVDVAFRERERERSYGTSEGGSHLLA